MNIKQLKEQMKKILTMKAFVFNPPLTPEELGLFREKLTTMSSEELIKALIPETHIGAYEPIGEGSCPVQRVTFDPPIQVRSDQELSIEWNKATVRPVTE